LGETKIASWIEVKREIESRKSHDDVRSEIDWRRRLDMSQSEKAPKLTYSFPEMNGDERLRELILYISEKCADDPTFGATKLNKILYFSDFFSYLTRGKPITGTEYMRLGMGPVPRRLLPIRHQLEEAGYLAVRKEPFYRREQHRTIPLRDADLSLFDASDIAFVDEMIRIFWGKTAREISELSHDTGWRMVGDKENIPYEAAYLSDEGLTETDIQLTKELLPEYVK